LINESLEFPQKGQTSLEKHLKIGAPICIAPTGDHCGEGILWDAATEAIYWTDINRFLVHRYTIADGALKTWFFPEPVTCVLSTDRKQTFALVLSSGVCLWEADRDLRHPPLFSLPGLPFVRCNEAGVSPDGNIWVGSMRNNIAEDGEPRETGGEDGILYRLHASGSMAELRSGIGISNTIVWSPDNSRFYFGDTLKNQIWSYEYDSTTDSIFQEQSFFCDFDRGLPDGSAIDAEGFLWNCRYGGHCIVRISPDGQVDRVIEMPVANPTNCAFGGRSGTTLYVTSAASAFDQWERFGGCLFAIETNVTGSAIHAFRSPKDGAR
jgi:sugar lactone lactonase YvrE